MAKRPIERKGWQWAPVPSDVILSKELTSTDVRVYAYLLWRAGQKDACWPSQATIASDLEISQPTVKLCISHLESNNWIIRQRRFGASSITYVYERQADCIADKQIDEGLTSYPTEGQPVNPSTVNQLSHLTRTNEPEPCNQSSPNGDSPDKQSKKKKETCPKEWMDALVTCTATEYATATPEQLRQISNCGKALLKAGATLDDLRDFYKWWRADRWRIRNMPFPSPKQIRDNWGKWKAAQKPPDTAPQQPTETPAELAARIRARTRL